MEYVARRPTLASFSSPSRGSLYLLITWKRSPPCRCSEFGSLEHRFGRYVGRRPPVSLYLTPRSHVHDFLHRSVQVLPSSTREIARGTFHGSTRSEPSSKEYFRCPTRCKCCPIGIGFERYVATTADRIFRRWSLQPHIRLP